MNKRKNSFRSLIMLIILLVLFVGVSMLTGYIEHKREIKEGIKKGQVEIVRVVEL
ncbi:MAG: hypothetical protein U0K57_04455 [Lachnospiraceae bacterium]|nr:hypothetical protein [Lachnospiraceae bacterium]